MEVLDRLSLAQVDGINLELLQREEMLSIEDALGFEATGVDHSETIQKVKDGELQHMDIKLVATCQGVELASDSLGSCIYKDLQDFVTAGDYITDMIDTVITESKNVIAHLATVARRHSKEDEKIYTVLETYGGIFEDSYSFITQEGADNKFKELLVKHDSKISEGDLQELTDNGQYPIEDGDGYELKIVFSTLN